MTGFLVLLSILTVGLLVIHCYNRAILKKMQKRADKYPSATRQRNDQIEFFLSLDETEQAISE